MIVSILRTRPFKYFVAVVVVIGAGALLWASWLARSKPIPEDLPPAAPVKWMEARQFFVEEWTEVMGTAQPLPQHAARIQARADGSVVSMLLALDGTHLTEGQRVKKGDIIVQLDSTLLKANLDKLEATQEELKEQTKQAEFALTSAEKEVERLEMLKKDKLVSPVDLAKAKLALQDAQSKLKASNLHENTGMKDIRVLHEQIKLLTLTASIDGRLGRLLVVQGQTIASGTMVADIVDIDDWIDVLCFVPPAVLKKLARGQPARIGGLEDPQDGPVDAEGKVEYIANQAEIDTGNFAVKIRFPNKSLGLQANTSHRVRVLTTPGKACLTLPESALMEDQQPPAVIVVDNYKLETKDGKDVETGEARRLLVKVGIRDRTLHLVEIIGLVDPENKWRGNMEEARFVIEKGRGLRNGDPIRLLVEED